MAAVKLCDIVNNSITDKNTTHSYLDIYQKLLCSKKDTATRVLEVGIQAGGSIKLWRDYFTNAVIYGVDINAPDQRVPADLLNNSSVKLYNGVDAYNTAFITDTFVNTGLKFDVLVDDGPHTLISMEHFIVKYLPLLKDDGILIIEDVPQDEWIKVLTEVVPENLKKYIQVFDLRTNKGRFDDMLFVVNRSSFSEI